MPEAAALGGRQQESGKRRELGLFIRKWHGTYISGAGEPLVEQRPVPDSQESCPQQIGKPAKEGAKRQQYTGQVRQQPHRGEPCQQKGQERGSCEEKNQQTSAAESVLIQAGARAVCPRDAHTQDDFSQRPSPCQAGDKGVIEEGKGQKKPAVLCPFPRDQRIEDAVYDKDENKVKAKGQQAPGQGDFPSPAQAGSVHIFPGGQETGY